MNRCDQRAAHFAPNGAAASDHLVERRLDAPQVVDLAANLSKLAFGKLPRLAAMGAVFQPQQFLHIVEAETQLAASRDEAQPLSGLGHADIARRCAALMNRMRSVSSSE